MPQLLRYFHLLQHQQRFFSESVQRECGSHHRHHHHTTRKSKRKSSTRDLHPSDSINASEELSLSDKGTSPSTLNFIPKQASYLCCVTLSCVHVILLIGTCSILLALFKTKSEEVISFHFLDHYNELFAWNNFNLIRHKGVQFEMRKGVNVDSEGSFLIRSLKNMPIVNETNRHYYKLNYAKCPRLTSGAGSEYWTFFFMPGAKTQLTYSLNFIQVPSEIKLAIVGNVENLNKWLEEEDFDARKRYAQVDTPLSIDITDTIAVDVVDNLVKEKQAFGAKNFVLKTPPRGQLFFFIIYFAHKEHGNLGSCSLSFNFNLTTFADPEPSMIAEECIVKEGSSCSICCGKQTLMLTAQTSASKRADLRGQIMYYSFLRNSPVLVSISLIPLCIAFILDLIAVFIVLLRPLCIKKQEPEEHLSLLSNTE